MAFEPVEVLRVHAFGRLVGAVAPSGRRGLYAFEYDPAWRRTGIELAPTTMPTGDRRRTWIFSGLSEETFYGLPPLLADSLPDRFGNSLINAALAREGVRPEQIGALDRLAYLGPRGMGALTFVPATERRDELPTSIVLSELVTAARRAVQGDLSPDGRSGALDELLSVGSSAGGARAKAVIAWNRSTNEMRAGNLEVPSAFEQWLIKFDGVQTTDKGTTFGTGQEYGRVEYAYSLMARRAGIRMPETTLIEEHDRAHFMVKRFDRLPDGGRLHMQTLCALDLLDYNQEQAHDYSSLLIRADALTGRSADRQEIFRRIVFNVLASNNDDHTKNHSFLMDREGEWTLSPAYDLTYAFDPDNRWLRQHLMSVDGKFADVTRRDLLAVADRFEVEDAKGILQTVTDAVADWPSFAADAEVSRGRATGISKRLSDVRAVFDGR